MKCVRWPRVLLAERRKGWSFQELLSRLATGRHGFGAKIAASDLSEEMGASRFPAKAALNDLRNAGLMIATTIGYELISSTATGIRDFFVVFNRKGL